MTTTDIVLIIGTSTTAATVVIKAIADAFRQQKVDITAKAAHGELAGAIGEIKQQTNGQTERLQAALSAALTEVGRLQGLVTGLQSVRQGRATDPKVPPAPATP